jgi:hypothetical protein
MFVFGHVHAGSAERDTFHPQAEFLFGAAFPRDLDGSPGAYHAVPW